MNKPISHACAQFILDSQNLINSNTAEGFETLYNKATPILRGGTSELTKVLLSANIDVLKFLDYVPDRYLIWDTDIDNFTIPSHIKRIGNFSFGYSNIEHVDFSKSVNLRIIDIGAFSDCDHLRSVNLPDGLVKIQESAFINSALEHVFIPKSVSQIGLDAFSGCINLPGYIEYGGTKSEWYKIIKPNNFAAASTIDFIKCTDGEVLIY